MSWNPTVYDFGEGLFRPDPPEAVSGASIAIQDSAMCRVTLDHPPFNLVRKLFYVYGGASVSGSVDISSAVATLQAQAISGGYTLDYISVGFSIEFFGNAALGGCGDPATQEANFDGEGPVEAVSDPGNGWDTFFDINRLAMTIDGTAAEMAANYNTSGIVFTTLYTQEIAGDYRDIIFGGWISRPVAHSWAGQNPTNDGRKIMFAPGEFSTVGWNLDTPTFGEIHSAGFSVTVAGYIRIGGAPPPPPNFMCVL